MRNAVLHESDALEPEVELRQWSPGLSRVRDRYEAGRGGNRAVELESWHRGCTIVFDNIYE